MWHWGGLRCVALVGGKAVFAASRERRRSAEGGEGVHHGRTLPGREQDLFVILSVCLSNSVFVSFRTLIACVWTEGLLSLPLWTDLYECGTQQSGVAVCALIEGMGILSSGPFLLHPSLPPPPLQGGDRATAEELQ